MNTVETSEMERITVKGENVIQLPWGLLGFEHIKKFVLLSNPEEDPFRWLQVLEDPTLAFLVVSPFMVVPDYEPDLMPEDAEFLEIASADDAVVLNIVTRKAGGNFTINLKGPIVLNRYTLKGKQVVISNAARYSTQHPLPVLA